MITSLGVYCVFDLETTGLSANREIKELEAKKNLTKAEEKRLEFIKTTKDKTKPAPSLYCIAEIACCSFNSHLEDLPEFDSGIIYPYEEETRAVTDGALNANGITREQLYAGLDSQEVADNFAKYLYSLKKGRNKPILCGHNICSFDVPFLTDFMKIHGYDLSKYVNLDHSIDTMWRAREKWLEMPNYQLGTCCEEAGIELINAHRAINDTRANRSLVKYFLNNLRNDSRGKDEDDYERPEYEF